MDAQAQSQNAERLVRYLDSLGAEPSTPRVREYALMLAFLALLVCWLDSGNLGAQIVDERKAQIAAEADRCERNTRVAVAALNGWTLTEGEVMVACKRVKGSQ